MFGNLKIKLTPAQRKALIKLCQKRDPYFTINTTDVNFELRGDVKKLVLYCIRHQTLPMSSLSDSPESSSLGRAIREIFMAAPADISVPRFKAVLREIANRAKAQLPEDQRDGQKAAKLMSLVSTAAGIVLLDSQVFIDADTHADGLPKFEAAPYNGLVQIVSGMLKSLSAQDFTDWIYVAHSKVNDLAPSSRTPVRRVFDRLYYPSDTWLEHFSDYHDLKGTMNTAGKLLNRTACWQDGTKLKLSSLYWQRALQTDAEASDANPAQLVQHGYLAQFRGLLPSTSRDDHFIKRQLRGFLDSLIPDRKNFRCQYARKFLDAITLAVILENFTLIHRMKTSRNQMYVTGPRNGDTMDSRLNCTTKSVDNLSTEIDWEIVLKQIVTRFSRSQLNKFLMNAAHDDNRSGIMLHSHLCDLAVDLCKASSATYATTCDAVAYNLQARIDRQHNFWHLLPRHVNVNWKAVLKKLADDAC